MEKSRLRKKTDDGFDIGFILEPGTKLQHGDVISESDETILIEQLPEKTLTVKFKQNDKNLFLLVGHIIGNRHRPISIRNETISFPIHDNSEMELFERLFHEVIHEIDLSIDEQRFIPHTSMDVHEH
jgi:urease accessory protein